MRRARSLAPGTDTDTDTEASTGDTMVNNGAVGEMVSRVMVELLLGRVRDGGREHVGRG
jgi:hypothetical protein